jgi:hypothetical protein
LNWYEKFLTIEKKRRFYEEDVNKNNMIYFIQKILDDYENVVLLREVDHDLVSEVLSRDGLRYQNIIVKFDEIPLIDVNIPPPPPIFGKFNMPSISLKNDMPPPPPPPMNEKKIDLPNNNEKNIYSSNIFDLMILTRKGTEFYCNKFLMNLASFKTYELIKFNEEKNIDVLSLEEYDDLEIKILLKWIETREFNIKNSHVFKNLARYLELKEICDYLNNFEALDINKIEKDFEIDLEINEKETFEETFELIKTSAKCAIFNNKSYLKINQSEIFSKMTSYTIQYCVFFWSFSSGLLGFHSKDLKQGFYDQFYNNSYKINLGKDDDNYLLSKTNFIERRWYYITITIGNGNGSLYVNGKLESTIKMNESRFYGDGELTLGKGYVYNKYFEGKLAEFKVFDTCLSSEYIKKNYLKKIKDKNNLVLYYSFDKKMDRVVYDSSGNSNNGNFSDGFEVGDMDEKFIKVKSEKNSSFYGSIIPNIIFRPEILPVDDSEEDDGLWE